MLQKGFDRFAKLGCHWRYGRLLSAYLDNELSAQEGGVINSHLLDCASCRVELEQLRFANRALVEFEIPPMRNSLMGGPVFQPRIKQVSPLKRVYSRKIVMPLPLAAGVAIALIGATFFVISSSKRTPIQSTVSVPAPSSAVIKVVEVPVERVVIRTVYSRRSGARRVRGIRKENEVAPQPQSNADIARNGSRTIEWSDSTLKDFRPAASVNLRVVKGHEK
jgi:Putative zinc-finger